MNLHTASTVAWGAVLAVAVGFALGYNFSAAYGPSYHDAKVIERRLREVFCEQAIRNGLIKNCEITLGRE